MIVQDDVDVSDREARSSSGDDPAHAAGPTHAAEPAHVLEPTHAAEPTHAEPCIVVRPKTDIRSFMRPSTGQT